MRKKRHRLLAFLLMMVMLVMEIPGFVYAEEVPSHTEVQESVSETETKSGTEQEQPQEQIPETGEEENLPVSGEQAIGNFAGETLYFVDLNWESAYVSSVSAVFTDGAREELQVAMTPQDRGRYAAVIPEGGYASVGFEVTLQDGSIQTVEKENVEFYIGRRDTFYYGNAQEGSYWGADALYEETNEQSLSQQAEGRADLTGQTIYFVDIPKTDVQQVKKVTAQFYLDGHGADTAAKAVRMYEGRERIFSAPIPEGGYDEVTFLIEYADQTSYQVNRHFNIKGTASETDDRHQEAFSYEAGVMDTFFYNHVGQANMESMRDSYWGPHISRANRSLDSQIFYMDLNEKNGNDILLEKESLRLRYTRTDGTIQEVSRFPETRQDNVIYYQFPIDSGATEETVLEISGTLTTKEAVSFKFYYPYNSSKKMLLVDYIREGAAVFGEFVASEVSDAFYLTYDNKNTQFTNVQYRLKTENGRSWTEWANLEKTKPESWEDNTFFPIVEHVWGVQVQQNTNDPYVYVQFRGTDSKEDWVTKFTNDKGRQFIDNRRRENPYLWRTTNELNDTSRIPVSEFSYPCLAGDRDGEANTPNSTNVNINGVWKGVLDVDNRGDGVNTVPKGEYEAEKSTYYGNTTLYDYYSDREMQGKKPNGDQHGNTLDTSDMLNLAISAYSRDKQQKPPIYMAGKADNSEQLYQYERRVNEWSGRFSEEAGSGGQDIGIAKQGLVDSDLAEGQLTQDGNPVPLFDETFLRGGNEYGVSLGNIYKNVQFPFQKNERTGYWEFDSAQAEDALSLYEDVNKGYFLKRTGIPITGMGSNGFFPFNTDSNEPRNYLFGSKIDIPFTLPEGNVVQMEENGEKVPVTFEFSGDDDTWIFIDGKLVLDIGGIHDAIKGTINFEKKTYTVERFIKKDGKIQQKKPQTGTFELDDTKKEHTLTMFYMERGQGASNMKITFNFPKMNTLDVTNSIDTSGADPIFQDALSHIGSFDYEISNRVVSGETLPVEESAGYIKSARHEEFDKISRKSQIQRGEQVEAQAVTESFGETQRDVLKILEEQSVHPGSSPEEIRQGLVSVTKSKAMDISTMRYLRLEAYNSSDILDTSGESLYVSLRDTKGNRIGGWAHRLEYEDGNNGVGSKNWNILRLDLNKMTYQQNYTTGALSATFDRKSVEAVEFATRRTEEIYLDNLVFYAQTEEVPYHGFSVDDSQISDYGSVKSQELEFADGAWYEHYNETVSQAKYKMVEDGVFSLGDKQMAKFLDKFRVGSYIQIRQKNIDPRVFDTTWSILNGPNRDIVDENWLLPSRTDSNTIINDGETLNLTNVPGICPSDGRTSIPYGDDFKQERPDQAFVYRDYIEPDNDEGKAIYLTAAFRNTLKTGSIEIVKKLDVAQEDMQAFAGAEFEFDIIYTDVAGMQLEQEQIVQTVSVKMGWKNGELVGRTKVTGIPAGTRYEIRERQSNGLVLQTIQGQLSGHEGKDTDETTDGVVQAQPPYVEAVVFGEDPAVYTFTNTIKPFQIEAVKIWDDKGHEKERPTSILIELQRRPANQPDAEWENVTEDFYGQSMNAVTLSEENNWKQRSEKIPVLEQGTYYKYRIVEKEDLEATGAPLENYTAVYSDGEKYEENEIQIEKFTVTNSTYELRVVKEWRDGDDPARPTEITVQLQRATEDSDQFEDVGKPQKLSVHTNPRWEHVYQGIGRVDENGRPYQYRVLELDMKNAAGDTVIKVDNSNGPAKEAGDYMISYESKPGELKIINTKDLGTVVIEKKSQDGKTLLKGAKFKAERLKPKEGTVEDSQFETGKYNENWVVDEVYTAGTFVTGEDGRITIEELPYGHYRLTEVQAPSGYVQLKQPVDFEIDKQILDKAEEETGYPYLLIEIKNRPKLDVPESGARGIFGFFAAGLALMGAAIMLYIRQKMKQKQ